MIFGGVLLILETVLPGMVAGILGGLCLLAAVVVSYFRFGLETGNMVFAGVASAGGVGAWLWFRYFPGSVMARKFISQKRTGEIGAEQPELVIKSV